MNTKTLVVKGFYREDKEEVVRRVIAIGGFKDVTHTFKNTSGVVEFSINDEIEINEAFKKLSRIEAMLKESFSPSNKIEVFFVIN